MSYAIKRSELQEEFNIFLSFFKIDNESIKLEKDWIEINKRECVLRRHL